MHLAAVCGLGRQSPSTLARPKAWTSINHQRTLKVRVTASKSISVSIRKSPPSAHPRLKAHAGALRQLEAEPSQVHQLDIHAFRNNTNVASLNRTVIIEAPSIGTPTTRNRCNDNCCYGNSSNFKHSVIIDSASGRPGNRHRHTGCRRHPKRGSTSGGGLERRPSTRRERRARCNCRCYLRARPSR